MPPASGRRGRSASSRSPSSAGWNRTRTFEREDDEGAEETWAEYGVAAWEDHEALSELAAAIARDAAAAGADRARVLVPETPRHVSDAARARVPFVDEPDFVLERDLTGYGSR